MKGKYMRRIGGIVLGLLMLFGVTLATAAETQAQSRRRVIIVRPNPYRIYRPWGFRDRWYYRHFGYDPFGYDPWSPYGARYRQYVFDNSNEAVEKGYERGFKTGDVILEVAGKAVANPADVRKALDDARKDNKRTVLLRVKSATIAKGLSQ